MFFVLFLPLVLLFTPWFLRRIPYLNNFRLFFDTFQRCFKDEYRWFAAYYFICRVFILLIALYVPFGSLKRSILEASSVIIVVICLYLRPYKTDENDSYNWLNTLDAILLTNLCFVVIFSSSVVSDASDAIQDGLKDTVNVLAYVPLVYLVCLICYNGWKYFCSGNLNNYFQVPPQEAGSISETAHPPQLVWAGQFNVMLCLRSSITSSSLHEVLNKLGDGNWHNLAMAGPFIVVWLHCFLLDVDHFYQQRAKKIIFTACHSASWN